MAIFLYAEEPGRGMGSGGRVGVRAHADIMRIPDVFWIAEKRWHALNQKQRSGIVPICPDFVAESVRAQTTRAVLEDRLKRYIADGAKLVWMLDFWNDEMTIYRPNQRPERRYLPEVVTGEDVMPDFVFDFKEAYREIR